MSRLIFWILLLILLPSKTTLAKRVIDRFPGSKIPKPKRCLIGLPEHFKDYMDVKQLEDNPHASYIFSLTTGLIRMHERMNCSTILIDYMSVGTLSPNGSYDGLIGSIQRNEIDAAISGFRTDSFGDVQPGYFGLVLTPADVVIISRKNASVRTERKLIQVWASSFDVVTVAFVFIALYLFVALFSFASNTESKPFGIIREMIDSYFIALFAFIDKTNFDADSMSTRTVVLCFNLFLLFAFHGIALGVLGADLIADIDPPIIESLSEFENDSWTQPVILKQLWLPPVLEASRPGSELFHLKQVMSCHSENFVSIASNRMEEMSSHFSKLIMGMVASRKALLVTRSGNIFFGAFACIFFPSDTQKLAFSKTTFAHGALALLYSKKIDPHLRSFWDYIASTFYELGFMQGSTSGIAPFVTSSLQGEAPMYGTKWRECVEKVPPKPHDYRPFALENFSDVYVSFGILMLLSAIIFAGEFLVVRKKQKRKTKVQEVIRKWRKNRKLIENRQFMQRSPKTETGFRKRLKIVHEAENEFEDSSVNKDEAIECDVVHLDEKNNSQALNVNESRDVMIDCATGSDSRGRHEKFCVQTKGNPELDKITPVEEVEDGKLNLHEIQKSTQHERSNELK